MSDGHLPANGQNWQAVPTGKVSPHLLVALTAHGFGHGAMTAPVINDLRRRLPGLKVTLQTSLPAQLLATRYEGPFDLISDGCDFGLRMASATEIRLDETAAEYRALHGRLDQVVAREAQRLQSLGVDLLLCNIPYVPLLAARRAGIPAIGLCCLNWADIYGHYFHDRPEGPGIEAEMLDAYGSASTFLCPAPSMPMERLANTRPIGPIAPHGCAQPDELRRRLGLDPGMRLGLVAFGGVDAALPFAQWPQLPGWRWLTTGDPAGQPHLIPFDQAGMGFTDLLASCDVVITKPGYGTFTEAAVNGRPVLYVPRGDWPESRVLIDWLSHVGRCRPIGVAELFNGAELQNQLQSLFSAPPRPPVEPTGTSHAAAELAAALLGSGCMQM